MTGRMNTTLDQLTAMLVASPTWIAWCGGSTQAAANVFTAVAPVTASFPHAMIDLGPSQERSRQDIAQRGFMINGELWLLIVDHCAITSAGLRTFRDHLDGVLGDLENAPNNGANLRIRRTSLVAGPQFVRGTDRDSTSDEIEVKWQLDVRDWP